MKLRYIVDIFHAEKHTSPKCVLDLQRFKDVRGMNMEICEQSFHLLNSLKYITGNITYAKRLCLMKIIDDDHNNRLVSKLILCSKFL